MSGVRRTPSVNADPVEAVEGQCPNILRFDTRFGDKQPGILSDRQDLQILP